MQHTIQPQPSKTSSSDATLKDRRTSSKRLKENSRHGGPRRDSRPQPLKLSATKSVNIKDRALRSSPLNVEHHHKETSSSPCSLHFGLDDIDSVASPSATSVTFSCTSPTPASSDVFLVDLTPTGVAQCNEETPRPGDLDETSSEPSDELQDDDLHLSVLFEPEKPPDPHDNFVCLESSGECRIAYCALPLDELCAMKSSIEVKHTPESGYGLYATEHYDPGSTLLIEHPAIILPFELEPLLHEQSEGSGSTLMTRLPCQIRQEIMKLSNCTPFSCGKVEGVIKTNSIPIELDLAGELPALHRGIFITASRCNHSCVPNTIRRWHPSTLTLNLEAVRPIKPGEQITVPYIPPDQPRSERVAQLQDAYNFTCRCPACHLSEKRRSVDDDVRQQLHDFYEKFPSFERWCFDLAFPDDLLIRAHQRVLDLIEKTELEALGRQTHIDAIAMCYGALGDEEQFTSWINQVSEARVKRYPESAPVFEKWTANPQAFPLWNWRNLVRDGNPPDCESGFLARFFSPPSLPRSSLAPADSS
ncbi:hypothetical protein ONZ45_g139 [Pleurotus djamor]|nr:hypothetical protein ONZ45_g139 [Pleurotus djamor]